MSTNPSTRRAVIQHDFDHLAEVARDLTAKLDNARKQQAGDVATITRDVAEALADLVAKYAPLTAGDRHQPFEAIIPALRLVLIELEALVKEVDSGD